MANRFYSRVYPNNIIQCIHSNTKSSKLVNSNKKSVVIFIDILFIAYRRQLYDFKNSLKHSILETPK